MSSETNSAQTTKPAHIDLTAQHTREPDVLGKCLFLYFVFDVSSSFDLECKIQWTE